MIVLPWGCAHWLLLLSFPPCLAACFVERCTGMPLSKARIRLEQISITASQYFWDVPKYLPQRLKSKGASPGERQTSLPRSQCPFATGHQVKLAVQPRFLGWAGGSLRARAQWEIRWRLAPGFSSQPSDTPLFMKCFPHLDKYQGYCQGSSGVAGRAHFLSYLSIWTYVCGIQEDHNDGNHGREESGGFKQHVRYIYVQWLITAIVTIAFLILPKELRRTLMQTCANCNEMDPLSLCHLFSCFSVMFLC